MYDWGLPRGPGCGNPNIWGSGLVRFNILGLRVPLGGTPKIPEKAGQVFLLSGIFHTAIKQNFADVK